MHPWPPPCYQRAVAFVTDPDGRLLVFDHIDVPSAGTQVPAGGIHDGEAPEVAVVRELVEESGIDDARLVRKLGEVWRVAEAGNVPAGLEEQVGHAFHLVLDDLAGREAWEWDECDGGDVAKHRFALRWAPLDDAADQLWPTQAMWLHSLRCSLDRLTG
ncbi:MAG: NUDIX domain-containing protein [Acidimicrobiales bacterium]